MTIGSSGTGMDNSIPEVQEQEGNEKNIPKHRERKGNEKIQPHNWGTGIRDLNSWEWRRGGIPARPCGIFTFLRSEQVDRERSLGQLFEAIVFSV